VSFFASAVAQDRIIIIGVCTNEYVSESAGYAATDASDDGVHHYYHYCGHQSPAGDCTRLVLASPASLANGTG
jgi:hypothetical protein